MVNEKTVKNGVTSKSKQDPKLLWLFEQTKLYFFDGVGPWKYGDPEPSFNYTVLMQTIHELAQKWIGDASDYFSCLKGDSLEFYQRYNKPTGLIFGEFLIIHPLVKGVRWELALLESRRDIRMPVSLELTLRFENEGREIIGRFIKDYPKVLRHFLQYRIKPRFMTDEKILAPLPLNPTPFEQLKAYFAKREEVFCQFELYYDFTWKSTLQTITYAVRNMFAIYDLVVAIQDSRKNSDLLIEYYLGTTKRLRKHPS